VTANEDWFSREISRFHFPAVRNRKETFMKRIMKSRIIASTLMVSSLLVMAASVQARADKIRPLTELVLQDDNSGSFLLVDVKTGEYKFHDCKSGFAMGGFVKVTFTGCAASVKEESEGRLVVAEIDLCSGKARAYLATETIDGSLGSEPPTREFTINDSSIRDSVAECKAAEN
jgi:hypothetical protein